jgi:transketolase C-terminal domain/subunit
MSFWQQFPTGISTAVSRSWVLCYVAAGLAACGHLTAFHACDVCRVSSMRALDLVRNGAALHDLNVK